MVKINCFAISCVFLLCACGVKLSPAAEVPPGGKDTPGEDTTFTNEVRFLAGDPGCKTAIRDGDVIWDEEESIRIWENGAESSLVRVVSAVDGRTARLTADFGELSDETVPCEYHAVSAKYYTQYTKSPYLPDTQYPRYGSHDPEADVLFTNCSSYPSRPVEEVPLQFTRASVIARLRLAGLSSDEAVQSVAFSTENPIAGSIKPDFESGTVASYGSEVAYKRITMKFTEDNAVSPSGSFDAYFTAFPGETGAYSVDVITDKHEYLCEFPSSSASLSSGEMKTIDVNMSQGTVSEVPSTYVFTNNSWADETSFWDCVTKAYTYVPAKQGVQVTTTKSGAGAVSKGEFLHLSKVIVRYCTNAGSGEGSVVISCGSHTLSENVSAADGVTLRDLIFDFSSTDASGKLNFAVNCTTNSIYIHSITVYGTIPADPGLSMQQALILVPGQQTDLAVSKSTPAPVSFASSNEAVATVDANGRVTAVATGYASISATVPISGTYNSGMAVCYVRVKNPSEKGVDISGTWLDNYEIPASDVEEFMSAARYHGTAQERFGKTKAYWYNPSSASGRRIVTHTFEYGGKIHRNYSILYDKSKKAALWVAFNMNGDLFPALVGRNDAWTSDPAIPEDWQPATSSYKDDVHGNSFDCGHQTASGDHLSDIIQNQETFYYSNMTPQVSNLNRGVWKSLEGKVQNLGYATTGRDTLYVVTGPIFDEGYWDTFDAKGVSCPVPSRYFKCIMKCSFDQTGKMTKALGAAYMFDNAKGVSRQNVTIDFVELLTGFDFFPKVPDELEMIAEANSYEFF